MDAITEKPDRERFQIGDATTERGTKRIPFRYAGEEHVVKVPVPDGQEEPAPQKVCVAVSREIDRLHRKVRKERHSESADDIRDV
jgi:hypothetical protein